jgi:hypothetical protein
MWLVDASNCNSILYYAYVYSLFPCDTLRIYGILFEPKTYTIVVAVAADSVLCDGSGKYGPDYNLDFSAEIAWLYTDIYGGSAPPQMDIEVIMDAMQLSPGTPRAVYNGYVVFESNDPATPVLSIPVQFTVNPAAECYEYLPGDANMYNGGWPPVAIGGDITFLINYFRGLPSQPCLLDGFWCSADANGDCNIIGSDVTKMVSYFRGFGTLSWCPDYVPCYPPIPPSAPAGWPNCEPLVTGKIIPSGSGK